MPTEETKQKMREAKLRNPTRYWLGKKRSEETNKKISNAHLGKKLSEETKRKMSERLLKNPINYWVDKNFSREHISKIKVALKGRKFSDEHKKKLSESRKDMRFSEAHRKNLSLARIKSPNRVFKNTSIEIKLQKWLQDQAIEFETNYPILGRPDIFIKPNVCIFADGDYWHNLPEHKERDKYVTQELQKQGYTVIRLWEHDINKNEFNNLNQLLKC